MNFKLFISAIFLIIFSQSSYAIKKGTFNDWTFTDMRDIGGELISAQTNALETNVVSTFGKTQMTILCTQNMIAVGFTWKENKFSPSTSDLEVSIGTYNEKFNNVFTAMNPVVGKISNILASNKMSKAKIVGLINRLKPANFITVKTTLLGENYYAKYSLSGMTKASRETLNYCGI
jgi:hypothetical protein